MVPLHDDLSSGGSRRLAWRVRPGGAGSRSVLLRQKAGGMKHDIDPCTGNCLTCGATREAIDDNLADPKACYGKEAYERRIAAWSMVNEVRNARWRNGEVLPGACSDAEVLRCEDEI